MGDMPSGPLFWDDEFGPLLGDSDRSEESVTRSAWERARSSRKWFGEKVQERLGVGGAKVSQKSQKHHSKPDLHRYNPILHQCKRLRSLDQKTFCTVSCVQGFSKLRPSPRSFA